MHARAVPVAIPGPIPAGHGASLQETVRGVLSISIPPCFAIRSLVNGRKQLTRDPLSASGLAIRSIDAEIWPAGSVIVAGFRESR